MLTIWVMLTGIFSILIAYGYWVKITRRFTTLEKDKAYCSAEMKPAKLNKIIRIYRIRAVIDFRRNKKKVNAERAFLEKLGVKYYQLQSKQVPDENIVNKFIKIISCDENIPVLFHCTHGAGRTVLFAAIYRMEFMRMSNRQVVGRALWRSFFWNFRTDSKKGRFLRSYVPFKTINT
jgi:protein tyrosine phosphatase (PTP) superfamily phosphohydrolase (DUF442 family)